MADLAERYSLTAREFPDFDLVTMPTVPEHWSETSWHNDTCPSFQPCEGLRVFVDYADQSLSEWCEMPADQYRRFNVQRDRPEGWSDDDELYSGNDWNEALAAVEREIGKDGQ